MARECLGLHPLLDHLATAQPLERTPWQQWRIERFVGGANNVLYRVTDNQMTLAVKFTIRDGRDRAGREYGALRAVQQLGEEIAPQAVFLERDRYPQPVVVQTWLAGAALEAPPANDGEWGALIDHLHAIHSLTPGNTSASLPPVVLTMRSADEGRARIQENVDRVPPDHRPKSLYTLLAQLDRTSFPTWSPPHLCLCRGDGNCRNFLRRLPRWASVDWEYSGWSDPAFEIADLLAAPTFLTVTPDRREWVIDAYCARSADPTITTRIWTYYQLMLIWWVVRFARSRYEIPLGRDQRLAERPATWREDNEAMYDAYFRRAEASFLTQSAPATAVPGK